MGLTILKYVADIFQREPKLGEISSVRNIYDHHQSNIFIIINTNREDSNIKKNSSGDIQPQFDINKVSCPRCRYRAEKALNLLKSKTNLQIDDIKGICDHCIGKAQLSQKPCAICEETVKKFLEETNAKERTDKSIWYKQRVSHIHRPFSSDRSIKKIHLDTDTPKSGIDTLLDLKLALRTKTDLYKPLLVTPKHQLTLKKSLVERSSRDTPKINEFPSDESVITSFITTFSKTRKDQKERSFKYVFPEEKLETHESKAVEITSSELIKMTHDRARQQIETQREIGGEKYQEIKAITGEIEPMIHKVKLKTSEKSDLQYFKDKKSEKGEVRPQSSETKPTRSVMESKKSETRPRSSEIKPTRTEKERGKGEVRPRSQESKSKKDETKPTSQYIKTKKPEVGKKGKQGEEKTLSREDTVKQKVVKSQSKEAKKTVKPPPPLPPLYTKQTTKDLDKDKIEKQQLKPPPAPLDTKQKKQVKPPPPPLDTKQKTKDLDKDKVQKKQVKPPPPLPPLYTKQTTKDLDKDKIEKQQLKTPPAPLDTKQKKQVKPPPPPLDTKQKTKDLDKDKVQKKQVKPPPPPPPPPLYTKQKTKDLDEDKAEKQQDSSEKDEKKGKNKYKEDKIKKPSKEKPELQEGIKKVTRMGEKKIPKYMMSPKLTTKETKDSKSTEIKVKSQTKLKKAVKPPEVGKKPKKDEQNKPSTDTKVDKVSVKSKATQAKEAENRRKERLLATLQKPGDEQQEETQVETKEEKHEVKKEDDSKKTIVKAKEKEKEKVSQVINEDEKGKVEKKDIVYDILKFIPTKKVEEIKVVDPLAAVKLAQQRMKDLEAIGLATARKEAEKKGVLHELPRGEHFLFRIKAKEVVPQMEEEKKRKLKDLQLSTIAMKAMKMRGPSFDDLILKMVKLGKTYNYSKSSKIQHRKEGKYKIRSAKRNVSLWSLSVDSDVELEIDRLAYIVKIQHIRHKIKGQEIVKNVCDKQKPKLQPDPILFYKSHKQDPLVEVHDVEETQKVSDLLPKGITRYSLSDPTFIEKGWTVLPTMKVVRKMNVYKMQPAYPEFDWFNYNKKKKNLTYDSGEKLADFDDNGRGRWYYKNGRIALDYYDSEDIHAQQRFVLYGSGEEEEHCRSLTTVLGLFDYLGNGVVFDYAGKIRVKYNQSEGVLLDSGIGPTSRWKWHSLNDPPVLKQVMINTFTENPDPHIQKFEDDFANPHKIDEEMLAIEIENVIKEKTKMQKQKFHQFQIKMKALKINKQLSLRILDQAHVYLYFRDGTANMKLNLGMVLNNHEIIDTDTTDVGDVSNVLEKFPPQTDSIVNLQDKLEKIRRCDRERTNNLMRVRTILPISSADKLIQAKSKPARPPLSVACAPDDDPYTHRKPPKINLYYNTRLI